MTRYRDDFDCPVAFEEQDVGGTMAEVLAGHGVRQLHVAETEKYAHVTYFFNGGREEEWAGRRASSCRRRATCHLRPEARDVGGRGGRSLRRRDRERLRLRDRQFREPGHGRPHGRHPGRRSRRSRRSTPASAEWSQAVEALGGVCLVTADHGNAEQLLEADGVSPHTAHTLNPVPLVVTIRARNWPGRARSPTSSRPPLGSSHPPDRG